MRIRTGYSFRVAAGSLSDVMDIVEAQGHGFAPITDRTSTFGFNRWMKMAKERGLKPVFGVELAVTKSLEAKKPSFDYWTFFAKDDLSVIHDLVNKASGQKRYENCLLYDQALEADCYKVMGNSTMLENVEDQEDLFYGLSPSLSVGMFRRFKQGGFKPFMVCDNKYPRKEDFTFYEVLAGRNASDQTYPQHIIYGDEWEKSLNRMVEQEDIDQAVENAMMVMNASKATLHAGHLVEPKRPMPLKDMCIEGAKKLGVDLSDPVYRDRLEKELDLIHQKEFEDYFYIIADMVKYARSQMVVGPARGSSCGSLVCYLLEITTIDPIPYGLIFERFIDINRDDLPDIDIDFSDQKRHKVFEYMAKVYGKDHIARLGTVAMYQPRSAVNEAGAALKIPRWKCDSALDSLIVRSGGDSRALDTLEDTLRTTPNGQKLLKEHPEIMVATKMEGHPRHHSQHAAGIIVTDKPVNAYVATDQITGATHCDKKDAEELNLLKIDALGLTQLSVFEDALQMAGLAIDGQGFDLESIPLDDKKAFDVLNDGHFSGIFQFNGLALQSLTKQTKVVELDDIIAITALARPGPLTSGGATEWIKRKNGESPISYPHPLFQPFLEDTRGIVLYQEQVMEIGRQIGDLSWGDVTALRKAMSKSLGKEYFDQFGDKFKEAAHKKGIPMDVLEKVWDDLCAYGAWAFNKSHSVAYGLISYWCCWLKANYPLEFAAATLNHEDDPAKQIAILRELHEEGIGYKPVDVDISTSKWQIDKDNGLLVGPVQNVKGVGPKTAQMIDKAREGDNKLSPKHRKLLTDPVTPIDSLWPITDRINEVMPDPSERNIHSKITKIGDIGEDHDQDTKFLIIAVAKTINPRDENEPIMVARRKTADWDGVLKDGPIDSLNLQMEDDSGIIYCKVSRFKFHQHGKHIVDRGRPGKSIYAIKGTAMANRRFLMVDMVRYIGDMDPKYDDKRSED